MSAAPANDCVLAARGNRRQRTSGTLTACQPAPKPNRPGALFVGIDVELTILLGAADGSSALERDGMPAGRSRWTYYGNCFGL
jgi:hypothetical protein